MKTMPINKYKPYPPVDLSDRTWPSKAITRAPSWCSVDLRDGNQALVTPMSVEEKLKLFRLLVDIGFKEIEVGFPSASQIEFDFVRLLIEGNLIPADVTIQVLTQAREHLIRRTVESLQGARRAVVHLYNSTSELQRRVVFRMSRREIVDLAMAGARLIREETAKLNDPQFVYEYSPESFTGTELDFAVDICEAVMDVWQPSPARKVILNLPSTVEMSTPNIYADQIEWFGRNIKNRDSVILSVHAHNDRGTGVAATELALLAGAERVEGTLFGNGERTGNVDLATVALNMFSQGVDPGLDFRDMKQIMAVYEQCTKMKIHERHPYAGELVYTAFSGSHQDAINKGMKARAETCTDCWEVPYLPIDPADVGRTYESVIRINSQSGKGGVAYVLEQEFGFSLPREMYPEFSRIIQAQSEKTGREVPAEAIREAFFAEYLERHEPLHFVSCRITEQPVSGTNGNFRGSEVTAVLRTNGQDRTIAGTGNGPIDAFCKAVRNELAIDFSLATYHEHALEQGSDSKAVAYIQIRDETGAGFFGAGVDTNISIASLKAVISGLNRSPLVAKHIFAGNFIRIHENRGE
ncbi:MAG TPA: 2-isopropylmalate synthase [Nitrospirota bacterium]|nr:2-isopropylmalate synthase [Nitrospirota bacterium]